MSTEPRPISLVATIFGILACACLAACFFMYPINGYDAPLHLNWLSQYTALYRDSYTDLKWLPDSYLGFGAPVFYFYPPLVYWTAGLVSFSGITSAVALYQIVSAVFLILSGCSAFWLLRNIFTKRTAAVWGVIAYCTFLYRFVDLYQRTAFSEHAAFVFIPIVLLSFHILWKNEHSERYRLIFITAIGWAGLVLSNVPATIIAIYLFLLFIGIAKIYQRQYTKFLMRYAIGLAFAFAISAVYVLPASELSEALSSKYLTPFQFEDGALLSGYFAVDLWHDLANKTFYIALALVAILGISVGILLYKNRKEQAGVNPIFGLIFYGLVASLLFQVPYLLSFVWKILPGFEYLQFSWRWDIWLTLVFAVAVGVSIELNARKTSTWLLVASSVATIGIATYFYLSIVKREPVSAQNLLERGQEYLPSSATASPASIIKQIERRKRDPEIQVIKGSASISRVRREPMATYFEASASAPSELQFKRFYFPTWHLRDDRGVEYPLHSDSLGRIIASIATQGRRAYRLSIVKTNEEQIGTWLSVFGMGSLAALALVTRLSRRRVVLKPSP